jgi:uncharacterized protein (TIGR02266 family)
LREKRRSERVASRLRCWCEGEDVTFYARVEDLSEGGMFLRTLTPLGCGVRARVRLQAADEEVLAATATVVWSRQDEGEGAPGMGLAFDALDGATLVRLRELVARERRDALARASALAARPGGV